MARWSDFWNAADCVELCVSRLSKMNQDSLQVSDVNAVVGSENDVAVLLSLWYVEGSLTVPERQDLAALLRVSRLSCSFRQFLLPDLKWFIAPNGCDVAAISFVISVEGESVVESLATRVFPEFPSASSWFAPSRHGVLSSVATQERGTLMHSFSKQELQSMIDKTFQSEKFTSITSPCIYFCGFFWVLSFRLEPSGILKVFIAHVSHSLLPLPSVVKASYTLSRVQNDGRYAKICCGHRWFHRGRSWGGKVNPSKEDVMELLHDDKLVLKCKLQDVE